MSHNYNSKQTNYSLEQFTKNIFLFIKKNMKNIIFFTHSVGGIIPILLAKKYLKKKLFKKFINYEGNLTHYDTLTVTKKTSFYKKKMSLKKSLKNLLIYVNYLRIKL